MEKSTNILGQDTLRQEFAEGLLYIHARLSENTQTTLEAASFLYACIELLSEKGLLSIEALDERKREVAKRLVQKNRENRRLMTRPVPWGLMANQWTSAMIGPSRRQMGCTISWTCRPGAIRCKVLLADLGRKMRKPYQFHGAEMGV
jgi:hypothetical protein